LADSGFKPLEDANNSLKAALPSHLRLTPFNTDTCVDERRSRTYFLIHAVHSLCTIALYREYMAFLPFTVDEPKGPLDEPKIKETKPEEELRAYWIHQARTCFGAAKDLADLLHACQLAKAAVDAPFAGFAVYTVAWCGEMDLPNIAANR